MDLFLSLCFYSLYDKILFLRSSAFGVVIVVTSAILLLTASVKISRPICSLLTFFMLVGTVFLHFYSFPVQQVPVCLNCSFDRDVLLVSDSLDNQERSYGNGWWFPRAAGSPSG